MKAKQENRIEKFIQETPSILNDIRLELSLLEMYKEFYDKAIKILKRCENSLDALDPEEGTDEDILLKDIIEFLYS